MFFRVFVLSLVSLFLYVACDNNHSFEDKETVVALNFDSACLSEISPAFRLYRNEKLSSELIKKNFDCVRDTLDYIRLRIKGEKESEYSLEEIKNITNKFLFKDEEKDSLFYQAFFQLKADVLGGDNTMITFAEVELMKEVLDDLENLFYHLKPFASEAFFKNPFSESADVLYVKAYVGVFLTKWVLYQNKDFSLKSLKDLVEDFSEESLGLWFEAFNVLRGVSSSEQIILKENKKDLIETFLSYYSKALNLNRSLEADWETKRTDFDLFYKDVLSLLDELKNSVVKHPKKSWSEEDLMIFMQIASEQEILGRPLSVQTQRHVLRVLFLKYFNSETGFVELNLENLEKIKRFLNKISKFLEEAQDLEGHTGEGFPKVEEGESSYALFTQQRWPSLVSEDRILHINDRDGQTYEFNFQNTLHNSWQFELAKILIETYAPEERKSEGINLDEVKEAYLDLLVLLKELEVLGEESNGSWFRIFNEGNLFVPSAKSDALVSPLEGAEYFAYMFSAYFSGESIFEKVREECPSGAEVCSFDYVRKRPDHIFSNLPGLGDYFKAQPSLESYQLWQESLEYIAKVESNQDPYTKSHWFRGSVGNQYNEVIFRKYDLDHSDTLSFEETALAFPEFKEALKVLAKSLSPTTPPDFVLKGYFTYFVKHSKPPESKTTLFKHSAMCRRANTQKEECLFESDRGRILALLAYLTSIELAP